jgi:hypothetical protein
MALKIGLDNVVKIMRPEGRKFNLQDLNDTVDGFIEPFKIGPVWVMYDEEAKKKGEPLNAIASFFFQVPMHGTVLVVPSQQLPSDWDVAEPEDYKFTPDEIDTGVLISLQNALMYNRVFGSSRDPLETFEKYLPKEEWVYKPDDENIDENTKDFYRQVYNFISKNPDSFKKNVIIDEESVTVRVETQEDRETIVNQMITYFLETEEYEKCAVLKKVLE